MLISNFNDVTVGTVIYNPDCGVYTVVAICPNKDRVLLVQNDATIPNYVGVWALKKHKDNNGWCWGQGHYFGSDLKSATDYVLGIESLPKTVWVIHTDWTIGTGQHASNVYIYETYNIAKREFDKIVKADKEVDYEGYDTANPEYSWEETDQYWCIWKAEDYCLNHSEVRLFEESLK